MENKKEITIHYEKSNNYFETFATNFYGGISPIGLIKIILLEDTLPLPVNDTCNIDGSTFSMLKQELENKGNPKRIIKGEVNVPIECIPALIEWLQDKYSSYEKIIKEKEKNA